MPSTYYIGADGLQYEVGADMSPDETAVLLKALSSGEINIEGDDETELSGYGQLGEEYEIEGDDYELGEEYEIEGDEESFEVGAYELGASYNPFQQMRAGMQQMRYGLRQNSNLQQRSLTKGPSQMPNYSRSLSARRSSLNTTPQRAPMGVPPMVIRRSDPDKGRVLWLGFQSAAAIAAAATANVSSNPQDVFKPRKVIISASIAPAFVINDIRVGTISQLSSSDPIPAEAFVADSVAADVSFDTAQVSQQITFNVTNISGAAVTFRAAINGYVARN